MGILRKKRLWIGTVAVAIPLVALLQLPEETLARKLEEISYRNIEADTQMRSAIAGPDESSSESLGE